MVLLFTILIVKCWVGEDELAVKRITIVRYHCKITCRELL